MSIKIGFIGLGNIGNPMARQVLNANSQLNVYDAKDLAGENLTKAGAVWCEDIASLTNDSEIIFLSLPGPDEVAHVVEQIIASAEPETIILDLTTNSVASAQDMEKRALEKGMIYLDAPVSGGAHNAEKGALTVIVSGNTKAYEKAKIAIEAFGSNIVYLGESVGMATIVKLVNNQIFLSTQVLCAEALVLAKKAGLDAGEVLDILKTCSAAPFVSIAGLFVSRDFDTPFFPTSLANKDVSLAIKSAEELGVVMPTTKAAQSIYQDGVDSDLAEKNFTAIIQLLETKAGLKPAS